MPSMAHLKVSLFFSSSCKNRTRWGICWKERNRQISSPTEGHWLGQRFLFAKSRHNRMGFEARPERDLQKDLSDTDHTADSDALLSNKHSSSNPAGHDNLATIVEWRSNQLKDTYWLITTKNFWERAKTWATFSKWRFQKIPPCYFYQRTEGDKNMNLNWIEKQF